MATTSASTTARNPKSLPPFPQTGPSTSSGLTSPGGYFFDSMRKG